jgi:hypothetical protein
MENHRLSKRDKAMINQSSLFDENDERVVVGDQEIKSTKCLVVGIVAKGKG